ncbi:MAG: 16S rRNA (guanine(527)-N(7))-methyltransferase RsmG [Gammaproteobacteria bacterium]
MDAAATATLVRGLERLELPASLAAPLAAYADLLLQWNRRFNLTGARDAADLVSRHLLDCLAIAPFVDADPILDIGSGAGLPGLLLAMALPHRHFTLADANRKRTTFLEQARLTLGLANVAVTQADVARLAPDPRFAVATARAVATLPDLWALAAAALAPGGRLLAMKGRVPAAEVGILRGRGLCVQVTRLVVPGLDEERHLVTIGAPAGTVQ